MADPGTQGGAEGGAHHLGPQHVHSNLYVRNLPPEFDQTAVECMFRQFGTISGCKFFKTAAVPYAFIKLGTVQEALNAVAGLNGTSIMGRSLLVKLADTDAQYELPNENLYVRNAPMNWNEETIRLFFSTHGAVISVKLLPMHPNATGQAAMVRMGSVPEAQAAKDATNAVAPPGEALALNVKFADTPEEKARKMQKQQGRFMGSGSSGSGSSRYAPYPMAAGGTPGGPAGANGAAASGGMPMGMGADGMAAMGIYGAAPGLSGMPSLGSMPSMGSMDLPTAMSMGMHAPPPDTAGIPPWQQAIGGYGQMPPAAGQGAAPSDMMQQQQQQQAAAQQPPASMSGYPPTQQQQQAPSGYGQYPQQPPAAAGQYPQYPGAQAPPAYQQPPATNGYPGYQYPQDPAAQQYQQYGQQPPQQQQQPSYQQYGQQQPADPHAAYHQQYQQYSQQQPGNPYGAPAQPEPHAAAPYGSQPPQPASCYPAAAAAAAAAAPGAYPGAYPAPAAVPHAMPSAAVDSKPALAQGPPATPEPGSKIRIGNLPTSATRLTLYEKFAPFGATLSVAVAMSVGYVQYADAATAKRAVASLNNTMIGESKVQVMPASD